MIVLGLGDGHGAGAVLLDGRRVLAAVSEERLTRRKRERGFPRRSIEWVLRDAGVAAADVARVAYASLWGRSVVRLFDEQYRAGDEGGGPSQWAARLHASLENEIAARPALREVEERTSRMLLARRLAELGLAERPLHAVEHHTAHALGAVAAAGFARAAGGAARARELVLTLDGYGDGLAGAAALVTRESDGTPRLERFLSVPWERSLGLVYGAIAELLGFAEGDEGQVTAIAAGGDPERCREPLARVIRLGGANVGPTAPFDVDRKVLFGALRKELAGANRADVARALQDRVEEAVVRFARAALDHAGGEESRGTRLACAGGLFANVRLGARLAALAGVVSVDVCPAMGDDGLALGAALASAAPPARDAGGAAGDPPAFETVAWGPSIAGDDARRALERSELRVLTSDRERALAEAVEVLAAGGVVGVADARLELGPRALGQRSVLFDPRQARLAERVSRALKRPPHMPFAPATLAGDAERCYVGLERLRETARFMTVAVDGTPWFREHCPAAVHVDGSARVQLVTDTSAPLLHELLLAFRARTGLGTLVNTSFNLHGEPIVATAADAVRTFLASGLDGLLVGGHWVRHPHPLR